MNRTLTQYRSHLELVPYLLGESITLERKLSLFDYIERKVSMQLYAYNESSKTLYIPRGFSLKETLGCLATDSIVEIDVVDKLHEYPKGRDIILKMRPTYGAKDEHQIGSISFLVENDEEQKFVNMDTGYGKTFCTIKALSLIGKSAMIIMANSNLMKQWIGALKRFTYINDNEIMVISGRDTVKKSLKMHEKPLIFICSTQTISILSKEGELQQFVKSNGIAVKVTDEAHEMINGVINIDLGCTTQYNFYLTATPERSDTREDILFMRVTKTFTRFGGYTVGLKKFVHVKNVMINTYPSPWHKRICNTRKGFSGVIYEKFVFKNDRKKTFFYLICKYVVSRILRTDPEAKILIIFSIRSSINEIARLFKNNDKFICGIFTNDVDKATKEKQLKKNVILSTIKSAGSGMDIKNLRAIINFIPFKSPVLLHQLMGRLRYIDNKALFYFNVVDEGFDNIVRQNFYRQAFFKNKAADISTLKLDINTLLSEIYKAQQTNFKDENIL